MNVETIRRKPENMPKEDAVDYLLSCIENMAEAMADNEDHAVDAWPVKLTQGQRRIVICLYEAQGSLRTWNQIITAYAVGMVDAPSDEVVKQQLYLARRKLATVADIINEHGRGFRLVVKS